MVVLIDNQESWCLDDEYYYVGLSGGGGCGVGMIIIFVSLV